MTPAIAPPSALTKWRASLFARGLRATALAKAIRKRKLTYLVQEKLRRLAEALSIASRAQGSGCYVEAGVALGGTAIFIAKLRTRPGALKLFDVFGMIPPPGDADGADVHARYAVIREGRSTGIDGDPYYGYATNLRDVVLQNLASFGVEPSRDRVELHEGKFEDTMQIDEPVRFAHIDCDWHDSVLTCINRIWPKLALGGVIVFDDYRDYSGCRTAVDGFLQSNDGAEILFSEPSLAVRKIRP